MIQLYKLIQHYTKQEEEFVRRIFHNFEEVDQNGSVVDVGFIDPNEIIIIQEIKKHFNAQVNLNGGYDQAEKQQVLMYPDYFEVSNPVKVIEIVYNLKFDLLKHEQIMGTIYNLGISERKIGDIILADDGRIQIIGSKELLATLVTLALKIGRTPVKFIEIDQVSIKAKSLNFLKKSTKSLRADTVFKNLTKQSRNVASKEIKKGNFFVNFKQIKDITYLINEGDLLSIRGYGRIKIIKVVFVNQKYNLSFETTRGEK